MKKLALFCWHGRSDKLKAKIEKLFPKGTWRAPYYEIEEELTLDDFAERWQEIFMVLKPEKGDTFSRVCVTEHNSFGQR